MSSFKNRAKDKVEVYDDILVEYRINPKYPCKRLMEEARKRLAEILDINEPTEFFKTVDKKRDDLLDDAENTAPVFDFFKGDQRKIFEEAVKNLAYFGNSKTYVSDQELLKVVEEIETIVKDSKPFGKIQRLPELNKRFEELHMGLLEKEAAIMDPLVHDDFLKVKEVLDTKPFAEVLRPRINQRFEEIWDKLKKSNDIAAIKNIKLESDSYNFWSLISDSFIYAIFSAFYFITCHIRSSVRINYIFNTCFTMFAHICLVCCLTFDYDESQNREYNNYRNHCQKQIR